MRDKIRDLVVIAIADSSKLSEVVDKIAALKLEPVIPEVKATDEHGTLN